jgi:hypothetical protein
MYFYEFYDSCFEIVDNFTNSRLISEYVRFMKKMTFLVSGSDWIRQTNLHNKSHMVGKLRRTFQPWMLVLLKENQKVVTPTSHKKNISLDFTKEERILPDIHKRLVRHNKQLSLDMSQCTEQTHYAPPQHVHRV